MSAADRSVLHNATKGDTVQWPFITGKTASVPHAQPAVGRGPLAQLCAVIAEARATSESR